MNSIYLESESQSIIILNDQNQEIERYQITHESLCVFYWQVKAAIQLWQPPRPFSPEVVD